MKNVIPYIVIILLVGALGRTCQRPRVETRTLIDTLIIRDTIRDTLLVPQKVYIARTDTVVLWSAADTVWMEVVVPIERKEYRTADYFAVVEGYRPSLVGMEVFPETRYITRTETTTIKKRPKFGVGIQAGYGYGPSGMSPYVGVGVQYNLFTF